MRFKQISVKEIIKFLGERVKAVYGEDNRFINNLPDTTHVNEHSLDWINPSKGNKQILAETSRATVLLVDSSILYSESLKKHGKTLIVVDNPKIELARIGNEFFVEENFQGIHPSSIVDAQCELPPDVSIGPFSYIGKSRIGYGTVIGSNVRIYDDVVIGNHCNIKDGAIIGGAGFGFERDEEGNLFRFPQIGDVRIGNHVEVGANTCIDRGALSTTSIGDYSKINNLCHIAHNNTIGRNVVIAAEVNISGGSVIEDNCWIAPSSSIRGYVHVGEGCTVGTGAVVIKSIPSGEVWAGNPARKIR